MVKRLTQWAETVCVALFGFLTLFLINLALSTRPVYAAKGSKQCTADATSYCSSNYTGIECENCCEQKCRELCPSDRIAQTCITKCKAYCDPLII